MTGRITSTYLAQTHRWRTDDDRYTDWHSRIFDAQDLLGGDFLTITTGEEAYVDKPLVMNTAEKFTRDVARLVAEVHPIAMGFPKNDKAEEEEAADIRAAIADTYWEESDGVDYEAQWAIDLVVAGACFAVAYQGEGETYEEAYPKFERVDPLMCYPMIQNGKLYDLLVIKRMKCLVADRLFPGKGISEAFKLGKKNDNWDEECEIWEYYAPDETVKAISFMRGKKVMGASTTTVLEREKHGLGCPKAVMEKLATWDDHFRGLLDQSKGGLYAKNKAVKLIFDHTEEAVEASLFAAGIKNPDEPPGAERVYVADENWPQGLGPPKLERVSPPPIAPHLLSMLGMMDQEQRGQIGYPSSRQGNVQQSIASAAFVESTQGDLSSIVKEIHRKLARLRAKLTIVMAKIDVKYLDVKKPLCRSIGDIKMYTPSKAWDGIYKVKFVYGPASGVGQINALQSLIQLKSIGVMADDTLRSHQPEMFYDSERENEKLQREVNEKAIQQRFLTDPTVTLDQIADTLEIMEKEGVPLQTAYRKMRQAQLAAQEAAQPTPEQAAPGQLPTSEIPVDAEAEALALEKGKVPDAGGPEQLQVEESAPPRPLAQVFI